MRLIAAIMWGASTVMWLPWFAILVRLGIDLGQGVPLRYSEYLNPAFIAVWPLRGWLSWGIVSWWPIVCLLSVLLSYIAWRFSWWAQDWVRTNPPGEVIASVLIPPLALILLYRDAHRTFRTHNAELDQEVREVREQVGG